MIGRMWLVGKQSLGMLSIRGLVVEQPGFHALSKERQRTRIAASAIEAVRSM